VIDSKLTWRKSTGVKAALKNGQRMNETAPHDTTRGPERGTSAYRFADLTLHPRQHRLERDGTPIELGRLTHVLLVALVESAPDVLTHDDLVRAVWGGRSTTPETVTQRVKLLRDALGDDAEHPRYIGLVRGQGYRLIPPVERVLGGGSAMPVDVAASTPRAGVLRRATSRIAIAAVSVFALALAAYIAWSPLDGIDTLAFDITRLTPPGRVGAPAISPDGQYVVYPQLEADGLTTLWVQQIATGSRQRVLGPDPAFSSRVPTVSPDGFIDVVRPGQEMGLWRVPILGGTPRLFTNFAMTPIGWSPDGKRGAFVRYDSSENTLLVVRDADGTERVLAKRIVPESFASLNIGGAAIRPSWSPDGRLIALFELTDLLKPRVAFFDSSSGEQKSTLDLQEGSLPQGIGWLGPSTLVFSQPVGMRQRLQLWLMSYPGGAITRLTNDLSSYRGIDVDKSRTRLVTQARDRRIAVWIADAAGADAVEVVPWMPYGGDDVFMSWAGDRLLYDAWFNGRAVIAEIAPSGAMAGAVVPDGFLVAATPDGETIVFNSLERDPQGVWRDGLWRVDGSGQPPVRIASGVAGERVVTGDRSVVFVSIRSGVQSPWIVPLDGGQPMEIVREGISPTLDVSPDGRRVVFWSFDVRAIVVCELPRCSNRRELQAPPNYVSSLRWTPDGKELAYLIEPPTDIWALPLDGGAPHPLTAFGPGAGRIVRFAWSRDGLRLAFAREQVEESVVLLSLKR